MMLNTLKRTTAADLFLEYFVEAHIKSFLSVIKAF
jgi:hypothetical protein